MLLNKLFAVGNDTHGGFDLAALNIQRGRDHGIPTYTQVRELAGLNVPRNFKDLHPGIMDKRSAEALEKVYE